MAGPLLWLQNCLNRTADDREEEGLVQAVPLVPLMEENEDAMETASFQRLLRKLGVRAPADEQESFWRIPAKLRPSQLRAAASWLSQDRKRPTAAHTENHSSLDDLESTSDGDTPRAGDRGKVSAKRSRVLDSDEEREEDSSAKDAGRDVDPDSDEEAQSAPSKRRRQRAFVVDDEDED
ncbi:hypothetical protein ANANG_G00253160 [Anguilla anguilla]|uniref:Timeless C-terminal domain-containing protein n=1 Tax=Anguilla anguilla TaxID=7936 RepID=A0A9D3LV59_ANGAN|nr:hypothetical protein ANANG_G00253160 [Anguilla anguilla]